MNENFHKRYRIMGDLNMKLNRKQSLSLTFLVTTLIAGAPVPTFAHTHLSKSTPPKGAILSELPSSVTLQFSEELETSMSKIEVTDLTTRKIVSDKKAPTGEPGNASVLQITLVAPPDLLVDHKAHEFEVSWKAVSKDTHTMKGSYHFTVKPKAG